MPNFCISQPMLHNQTSLIYVPKVMIVYSLLSLFGIPFRIPSGSSGFIWILPFEIVLSGVVDAEDGSPRVHIFRDEGRVPCRVVYVEGIVPPQGLFGRALLRDGLVFHEDGIVGMLAPLRRWKGEFLPSSRQRDAVG